MAWKNLTENRISTLLLLAAVATGIGFQIPNTANMAGYEAELLREGLSNGYGDIRIRPSTGFWLKGGDRVSEKVRQYSGVTEAVSILSIPAIVKAGNTTTGTLVVGVDLRAHHAPFRRTGQSAAQESHARDLYVGANIADKLKAKMGDKLELQLIVPDMKGSLDLGLFGRSEFTIREIVSGTFGGQDSIFLDRTTLSKEAGTKETTSMISVYSVNHFTTDDLARKIQGDFPDLQVKSWTEDSKFLTSSVRATRALNAISHLMVLIAVSIPVLALLYIYVFSRRKIIGILSALGFNSADVFEIIFVQAALVAFFGAAIGCGIGYGLIRYFQSWPIFEWEGFVIRPLVGWSSFLEPVAAVVTTTLIAALYPAWRASRVEPASVLRDL